ncbi:MAG TPA: Wadjet anti-phage system protein JetD domain-containing protein [Nevskiaceae bacterium]|nr:Wadjet anti-phage system protein JetD domain-containing protein [Nevskiaceae bacterium]
MSWTTARDLKARLTRLWDRGELLRDAITGETRFPLRLSITSPTAADITERFDAVREWAGSLASARPLLLDWKTVHHRVQGAQKLPAVAWIDSIDDAVDWLGKNREWNVFLQLIAVTRQHNPVLLDWLARRPLKALELEKQWRRLLAVVDWMQAHPQPGIFLRQVDVPGVHSKFIEARRGVLAELFDLALPPDAANVQHTGATQFAVRYGFLDKPARIRFRILDPGFQLMAGTRCPDITLDAANFSQLSLGIRRVLITENEINFLALPQAPGTLAIFGSGYGWEALAPARWLERCAIHYWGDIDTHGFAILDQLRGHFGHVQSLLMDRATLEAHRAFWGREDQPQRAALHHLTPEEGRLYDDLRDNRLGDQLRLEQEQLGFDWVMDAIRRLPHVSA